MATRNKIVLIGDDCKDIYIKCSATRLAPEVPVPCVVPLSSTFIDGMAGNVYNNLLGLGLKQENLIYISPKSSITKTRYVDNVTGHTFLRVDEGEPIKKDLAFNKVDLDSIPWEETQAVIISDYCKGFLTERSLWDIIRVANNNGVLTFVDTKLSLGEWSKGVDYIKINKKEYDTLIAKGISQPAKWCKNLIVTLGAEGSWWVNRNIVEPVKKVNVADVCGCGDVYHAAFALNFLQVRSEVSAMKYANAAAAVAVAKQGVVVVKKEEVIP
jgi:bifunctional ADP-heptose synthase (sugar kinase/adenylyltransferase)